MGNIKTTDIVNDTTPQLGGELDANNNSIMFDDNTGLKEANGNLALTIDANPTAVNYIAVYPSETGQPSEFYVKGTDVNIGIKISGKGTGKVDVSGSDLQIRETAATTDTDKFLVSDTNVLKYRTGAEVLSDIGGAATGANSDITSLTGITGDIESVNVLNFNIAPTNASPTEGDVWWDADDHTLNLQTSGTPVLQIGQEMYIYGKNVSGGDIANGNLVYIGGAAGNRPTFLVAKANAEGTSSGTIAMATHTITNNTNGYATCFGLVRGLDTTVDSESTATTEGDTIYLSDSVLGGWTVTAPTSPSHLVVVGYVVRKHLTEGVLFIKISNGWETTELHDVSETTPATNEFLLHNGTIYAPTNFDTEVSANSDVAANTTHRTSDGSDHTFIDQSVISGATPTFTGTNFTGIPDTGVDVLGTAETLNSYLKDITADGFLDITTITDAGGLNISWVAGNSAVIEGVIYDMTTTGSPKTLTDDSVNYMYASTSGGTTFQFSTSPVNGTTTAIRAIIHCEGGDIIRLASLPAIHDVQRMNSDNLKDLHSELIDTGLDVAVDSDVTNNNDFTVATGTFYINSFIRETLDALWYSAGAGHASSLLERYYHSAGVWTDELSNGVDFANWDNGTNKTAVNAAKWYMAPIFWESDLAGGGHASYVYPQTEHVTEQDALDESIVYPPFHQGAVVPIAKFVFKGSATDFGIQAYFVDNRPLHATGAGGGANQNVFQTIAGDSGSTTADNTSDTLTITGGTGITTSVSGDTVTIAGDAASTTASGVVELATTAEIDTGTDTTRAIPVDQLEASKYKAGLNGQITVVFDGGGSVLTTGTKKIYLSIPYDGTITAARLFADQSGSIVIDVWKDTYANFPPTVADTITAAAKPTLSTAQKSEDTTLTGWTTSVTKGDVLEFNIDSVTTITKCILTLDIGKTGA